MNSIEWSCICCHDVVSNNSYGGPLCPRCERQSTILLAQGISPETITKQEPNPQRRENLLAAVRSVYERRTREAVA